MYTLSPQQLGFVSGGYCRNYDYYDSYDDDDGGIGVTALVGLFDFIDSSIEEPWIRTAIKVGAGAAIIGLIITAGVIAMNADDDDC